MKKFLPICIMGVLSLFAGCSTSGIFNTDKFSSSQQVSDQSLVSQRLGSLYRTQLSKNFKNLSDSKGVVYDAINAKQVKRMYKLSEALLKDSFNSAEVLSSPYDLLIGSKERSELVVAWEFVSYLLQNGNASQTNLADLSFYYECWIGQEMYENPENDYYKSKACKQQFSRLMHQLMQNCQLKYVVEFMPAGQNESGLSLDADAQNVIYQFLKYYSDAAGSNRFLIVGKSEQAIKVASFMNVQAGIDKKRLKLVVSKKIPANQVGLFLDNPDTRACFLNSHKSSVGSVNGAQNVNSYVAYKTTAVEEQSSQTQNDNNLSADGSVNIQEQSSEVKNSPEQEENIVFPHDSQQKSVQEAYVNNSENSNSNKRAIDNAQQPGKLVDNSSRIVERIK